MTIGARVEESDGQSYIPTMSEPAQTLAGGAAIAARHRCPPRNGSTGVPGWLRRSIARRSALLALVFALGTAACGIAAKAPPVDVAVAEAPHLLELGWKSPDPGAEGAVSSAPRAVVLFAAASQDPMTVTLQGRALGGSPVPLAVRVTANGGCEVGVWKPSAASGRVRLPLLPKCSRAGINMLELEAVEGNLTGALQLERIGVEAAQSAAVAEPHVEPARVGLQTRLAVISGAADFEWPLKPAEAGEIETAVALPGRGWARSAYGVKVSIFLKDSGGKERLLAERTVGANGAGLGAWDPVRAEVSREDLVHGALRIARETIALGTIAARSLPPFADPARFAMIEAPITVPRRAEAGGPPPVVLVVFDALRADHLQIYGYARPTAPNLSAFARDAVTFRTCLAPAPWTLPSIATILTGLYPGQHRAGLRHPLPPGTSKDDEIDFAAPFRTFRLVTRASSQVRMLPEVLAGAGYLTLGIVENSFLSERSGLARGFARYLWAYDEAMHEVGENEKRRRYYLHDLPARDWISRNATNRLFIFRHYISPHLPYMAVPGEELFVRPQDAPELGFYFEDEKGTAAGKYGPAARRRIEDLYDDTIVLADRRFGDLIRTLKEHGLYDNALVIVTSDHGEEFWDHGGWGHGQSLYDELMRVPLMVKLPGGTDAGRVVDDPARLIDLVPTILAVAGQPPLPGLPGRTLVSAGARVGPAHPFETLGEATLYGPPRRMARRDASEIIITEKPTEPLIFGDYPANPSRPFELYDMARDPRQKIDLATARPDVLAGMKAFLEERFSTVHKPPAREDPGLDLTEEEIEQLKSLGYASGH